MRDFTINKKGAFLSSSIPLILIVLTGFLIRLHGLEYRVFWRDEAILWLDGLTGEFSGHHAPLPVWIHGLFMGLMRNTSIPMARFPEVIFGTFAIFAGFLLGTVMRNRQTGITAAALIAVNPMAIYYSQECRPYGLFQVMSSLVVVYFIKALTKKRKEDLCVYTLLLILSGMAHLMTAPLVLTLALFLCLALGKNLIRKTYTPLKNILLILILTLLGGLLGLGWGFHRPNVESVLKESYPFGIEYFLRTVFTSFGPKLGFPEHSYSLIDVYAVIIFALFLIGLLKLFQQKKESAIFFSLYFLIVLTTLYLNLGQKATWSYWIRYGTSLLVPYLVFVAVAWDVIIVNFGFAKKIVLTALLLSLFIPNVLWPTENNSKLEESIRNSARKLDRLDSSFKGVILNCRVPTFSPIRILTIFHIYRTDQKMTYLAYGDYIRPVRYIKSRYGLPPVPGIGDELKTALPDGSYALVQSRYFLNFSCDEIAAISGRLVEAKQNKEKSSQFDLLVCDVMGSGLDK